MDFNRARADVEPVGDHLVRIAGTQAGRGPRVRAASGFRAARQARHRRISVDAMRRAFRCASAMLARIAVSSNGFSMKSSAPAFMARTARRTSPWPVMMTTGASMPLSISFSWNSMPSMPGMRTSERMQSGRRARQRSSAAAAPDRRSRSRMAGRFDQNRQRIAHSFIVIDDIDKAHLTSASCHRSGPPREA